MTVNKALLLQFIDENLEHGDNKHVAGGLDVNVDFVSKVRKGKVSSKRVLKALEQKALENKKNALAITQYLKQ